MSSGHLIVKIKPYEWRHINKTNTDRKAVPRPLLHICCYKIVLMFYNYWLCSIYSSKYTLLIRDRSNFNIKKYEKKTRTN